MKQITQFFLEGESPTLSNIPNKYNQWSFILTFIFNFHLKNMFTLKKIFHICLSTEGETR